MSLLDLALEVTDRIPDPFVAPIPSAEHVTIWTVQDGISYQFQIQEFQRADPGWYRFYPHSQAYARISRPATPAEYLSYLRALPRFYVILLRRLDTSTWLCVPFNAADATQRGWMNAEPRAVHLVRHAVEPFDLAVTRNLAGTLLYDNLDTRLPSSRYTYLSLLAIEEERIELPSNFMYAVSTMRAHIKEAKKQDAQQAIRKQQATIEGRVRWALDFMGASLESWRESGEGLIVRYAYQGYEREIRIHRDLQLDVAGICLAGGDAQQNLSSTVAVIQEARRRHAYDIKRENWL